MTSVKASLRNRGSGRLEFVDNTLKFYVERGRFKKTSEMVREIPIADIESATLVEKEFSVTWKGVADVFDVETAEAAKTLCDEVNALLMEPKEAVEPAKPAEVEAKEEEAPQQETQETIALGKVVGGALDVADSLFDVLRSLQGRVDWNRVESALKRSEESAKCFPGEGPSVVNLDFKGLSSAVKLHRAGEVSKETYGVLKSLFEYFTGLTVADERLGKNRPNCEDAKKIVLAHYTLNDIVLGVVVGDLEVEKETKELTLILEDLPKELGLKIDVNAVKAAVKRLITGNAEESAIEESRALLRKPLEELVAA